MERSAALASLRLGHVRRGLGHPFRRRDLALFKDTELKDRRTPSDTIAVDNPFLSRSSGQLDSGFTLARENLINRRIGAQGGRLEPESHARGAFDSGFKLRFEVVSSAVAV